MAAFCKYCGAKLDADAAFCPSCGKALPREAPPQKQFCRSCGAELAPGSAFCPVCGARQQGSAQAQQPAPPVRPNPVPAAVHSSSAARGASPQAAPNRSSARVPPPAGGGKKRRGKGLILLAVLVVLGVFAFTAFKSPGFLVKDKRPDPFAVLHTWPADYRPTAAPTERPGDTESGTVSADRNTVTLCGVTVDVDPYMLASGSREVSVSAYGSGTENGVSFDSYELRMGGDFERPVEVTFPCRIDGDTDVSVEHYEDGEWVPLLSFVDASAGTVSAYFGSFSPARVVYRPADVNPSLYYVETDPEEPWVQTLRVKDNYWAILRRTSPSVYGPEVTRFIDDPNNYSLPAPKLDPNMELTAAYDAYMQANQLWGFVDPLINMGIEALPYTSKSRIVSFMIDHSGKLSSAMNAIPFVTMGAQLAYDLKAGIMDSAGVDLYKNMIGASGTIYSLCTGYSNVGFSLAFLGVSVFGMELDYFVDAARTAQEENIRDVYKAYYEKVEPFDDDHWYLVFEEAYRDAGGDPDKAMARVKQAVDDYCGKFWTEVYKDANDDLIFAATDAGYKNVFMNATEEQKKALTEQQKQEVWRLIETKSMKKIQRFLLAKLQENTGKQLDQVVRDYNLALRVTIRETVNLESTDVAKYSGCVLALGCGGEPLPGWSYAVPEDTEDGWSVDFRATVYGYLRMGMPDQVLVYASEDDLRSGASPLLVKGFDPDLKGSRIATVELSGDRNVFTFEASVSRTLNGYPVEGDYTLIIEGGVLYYDEEQRLLLGQAKPGETITVTVISADGQEGWIWNVGHGKFVLGKMDIAVSQDWSVFTLLAGPYISEMGDFITYDFFMTRFYVVEEYTKAPLSSWD